MSISPDECLWSLRARLQRCHFVFLAPECDCLGARVEVRLTCLPHNSQRSHVMSFKAESLELGSITKILLFIAAFDTMWSPYGNKQPLISLGSIVQGCSILLHLLRSMLGLRYGTQAGGSAEVIRRSYIRSEMECRYQTLHYPLQCTCIGLQILSISAPMNCGKKSFPRESFICIITLVILCAYIHTMVIHVPLWTSWCHCL